MLKEIETRRSIRYFKPDPIPREAMEEILRAALLAPSPKNRQPWRFIVISGAAKEEMLRVMAEGVGRAERGEGLLRPQPGYIGNARFTMEAMRAAPVTVIVVNPIGRDLRSDWSAEEKVNELSNVQAVGAAAENMALEARALGIGSLWNGNIFFAYDELTEWLGTEGEMVLAMSFGYSAKEGLRPLPKMGLAEAAEWRE